VPISVDGATEMSAEQTAALADGVVEFAEYEEGFRRYRACLEAAGYELGSGPDGEEIGTMVDTHLEFSVPDAAVQSGEDERCYQSEYFQLDMNWQIAHADESLQTEHWRSCLTENGIAPAETSEEIWDQIVKAGLDAECLDG
jgi:hypothetical protein